VSIFIPIGLKEFTYLAKVALESDGYDVTLTNWSGLIYGELSKDDSKGDVFLDAWLPSTKITGRTMVKTW
jgi:glycine betaine/proline transport system substrate-binding protein